jgi:hypothetical protein
MTKYLLIESMGFDAAMNELLPKLEIAIKALDSIVDKYFDLKPELRLYKNIKKSNVSLIARQALKEIKGE